MSFRFFTAHHYGPRVYRKLATFQKIKNSSSKFFKTQNTEEITGPLPHAKALHFGLVSRTMQYFRIDNTFLSTEPVLNRKILLKFEIFKFSASSRGPEVSIKNILWIPLDYHVKIAF